MMTMVSFEHDPRVHLERLVPLPGEVRLPVHAVKLLQGHEQAFAERRVELHRNPPPNMVLVAEDPQVVFGDAVLVHVVVFHEHLRHGEQHRLAAEVDPIEVRTRLGVADEVEAVEQVGRTPAGIHRVIGIAYPAGWIQDPKGGRPIATFRLEVKDQKLPGLWTCRNREYIPSE